MLVKNKKEYFRQAKEYNQKVFKSKRQMRKVWAKKPIEEKIKELVKLQEIAVTLHPKLKRLIPWKLR